MHVCDCNLQPLNPKPQGICVEMNTENSYRPPIGDYSIMKSKD